MEQEVGAHADADPVQDETGHGESAQDDTGDGETAEGGETESAEGGETESAEGGKAERTEGRAYAFLTGAAYGALALAGAVVGMVESFSYSETAGGFPAAAIALCLIDFGLVLLAGRGMGTKLGAVVPAVTWLAVMMLFSSRRPEGDAVVVPGLAGYVYMLGGTLAVVVAIMLTPSSHTWLTAGQHTRPAR